LKKEKGRRGEDGGKLRERKRKEEKREGEGRGT
jgi:hypothetical protein